MNSNPLGVPQRESAGSETLSKYEYQYHWALCRILEEHKNKRQYALFMEYHEDVVLSDSLDINFALFEFNQVKNIKSPKYNHANVTARTKNKQSVLGKLLSSCQNKEFTEKIKAINLVASCGFSFSLKIANNLSTININDLSDESLTSLRQAIASELNIDIPENLNFIIPELKIDNKQDTIVGKIARVISEIYPNSYSDSLGLYRSLIDDLHRKGMITYDYNNWEDLLIKKAVTSDSISNVIPSFISYPKVDEIIRSANSIAEELGFSFIEKQKLIKNIKSIDMFYIGMPQSNLLRLRNTIKSVLASDMLDDLNIDGLIKHIDENINKDIKCLAVDFPLRHYIIYEIIVRYDHEFR